MVVKEDGTKWACASCLKGHRVSGCTHTDRELTFVPKKGRPVTQCQHCRVERKKRSAHVKCDCGEKHHAKEKCIHLREAEAKSGESAHDLATLLEMQEDDESGCGGCCHHGEKCSCSGLKQEPASSPDPSLHAQPRAQPRLTSTQSDGHITTFANGHHKPVHRTNHSAHQTGLPYRLPRSHTDHGRSAHARRSVESLTGQSPNRPASWQQHQLPDFNSALLDINAMNSQIIPQSTTQPNSLPMQSSHNSSSDQQNFFDFAQFSYQQGPTLSNPSVTPAQAAASGTVQQSSGPYPTDSDIDWTAVDWDRMAADLDTTQPALTYASSNTISDIGELTPPEERNSFMNQSSLLSNYNAMISQANSAQGASAQSSSISQSEDQVQRWSLPADFWNSNSSSSLNASPVTFGKPSDRPSAVETQAWRSSHDSSRSSTASINNRAANAPRSIPSQTTRSRPKPIYQRSNMAATTPMWEHLLSQNQAGDLWDTNDLPARAVSTVSSQDSHSTTQGSQGFDFNSDMFYTMSQLEDTSYQNSDMFDTQPS